MVDYKQNKFILYFLAIISKLFKQLSNLFYAPRNVRMIVIKHYENGHILQVS